MICSVFSLSCFECHEICVVKLINETIGFADSSGEDDEHDEASNQLTVTNVDLEAALNSVKPSVKRKKVA